MSIETMYWYDKKPIDELIEHLQYLKTKGFTDLEIDAEWPEPGENPSQAELFCMPIAKLKAFKSKPVPPPIEILTNRSHDRKNY